MKRTEGFLPAIVKKYGIPLDTLNRRETGLIEWICPCKIGHPIPESAREVWEHYNKKEYDKHKGSDDENPWFSHGCCGCCSILNIEEEKQDEKQN